MRHLGILLLFGLVPIFAGLAGCSSSSNGGSASTGGTAGTATGVGGGSNQGGQGSGGTGQSTYATTAPPCGPVGPDFASLPASANIATATEVVQAIALNGADVYYVDHGKGVYRITGGSGAPTLVVPAPADTATGHSWGGGVLQTDGTYVYFAQDESLYRSALTNPNPELLVTAASDITQVEIDSSYVYYVVSGEGTISRVPVAGGSAEELVTADGSAQSMQLVDGTLYFVNFDLEEVGRLPAAGGSIEYLTPYDYASEALAVSATNIYFNFWSSLYSVPISSPQQMTLLGNAGGDFMGYANFDRIKLAGDRLYWFDSGNNAGWTKTDGTECGLLFSGDTFVEVNDLAVGSDAVYVAVEQTLLKLPR